MEKTVLIDGMMCNNCTSRVEKVLSALDEVENVKVSLEDKKAVIRLNKEIENSKIKEIIEDIGFTVKEVK